MSYIKISTIVTFFITPTLYTMPSALYIGITIILKPRRVTHVQLGSFGGFLLSEQQRIEKSTTQLGANLQSLDIQLSMLTTRPSHHIWNLVVIYLSTTN